MDIIKTADLVDHFDAEVRFCDLPLKLYGRRRSFHGPIQTVMTFEDNALIRRCLEEDGGGRVLVVDAGGSRRLAVIGDMIAELGRKNGWAGIVLNGSIRDVAEVAAMDFGIYALGSSPKKSTKLGIGSVGITVALGGVDFVPGHTLYADEDGILVSAKALTLPVA